MATGKRRPETAFFFFGDGVMSYAGSSVPLHIRAVRAIDRFTDVTGTWVAWLNIPLVLAVSYEVVARYAFNAPTIWSYDITYMLYGTIFMLGAAYALHKGAHIRTDFFFEKWSVRTQGTIDSIAYIVFFFPSLVMFLVVGWDEAWYSFVIGETSEQTPWRPILWPFKMVIPLTCLLLIVQGVSETIKSVYAARTGVVLEHKEKVEV
jgi:TRAP-type mannitol/chloroaromatic compound transport system permease small subunit